MPSTLGSNEIIANLINATPDIKVNNAADNAAFDAVVTANDNAIIARFGEHPAEGALGFYQRRIALARLVGLDLEGTNRMGDREYALSRIGPMYR